MPTWRLWRRGRRPCGAKSPRKRRLRRNTESEMSDDGVGGIAPSRTNGCKLVWMAEEWMHKSVMLGEVLEALRPRAGGRYVDGTLGLGGHAAAILRASSPDGFLYGSDRDASALEIARERLAEFRGRFEL